MMMKVIGHLGKGAFGEVMKVEVDSEFYAVKKIQLEFDAEDDSEEMQDVRNEVKLMSMCLYHPNIVRLYSSFRQKDSYYIVMEYAGHRSLDDLALPITDPTQAAGMLLQITLALRHLQKLKIVHRDVKPANILISPKGLLKLADFGIGRQIENNTKSVVGTPSYKAPEIIRKEPYDHAVDVWSLGIVLYELLHGRVPFDGRTREQLEDRIKNCVPVIDSNIHKDLQSILVGCLEKNPKNRMKLEQILTTPIILAQLARAEPLRF